MPLNVYNLATVKTSPQRRARRPTVAVVTLGCTKNEVDSETMLGLLARSGWQPRRRVQGSDLVILNTCAFIRPAAEQSAETVSWLCDLRRRGDIGRLIVAGCLPQKYRDEDLLSSAPEVDSFIGTGAIDRITSVARALLRDRRTVLLPRPQDRQLGALPREAISSHHSRFIKISEGCSNRCAYCIIPQLRGSHRSRPIGSILAEVKALAASGPLCELNIIGQDTTLYGTDIYGAPRLPRLLQRISRLGLTRWIRVLYAHPAHVSEELIDALAVLPGLCHYIDIPMQHSSDRILRRMGRKVTRRGMERIVEKLRARIPGIAIRTTFIVGLPGETERDFEGLLDFVRRLRFERLGAFAYSPEDGTRAVGMSGQVPANVKDRRLRRLLSAQRTVSRRLNSRLVGKELEVLVDEARRDGRRHIAIARTEQHAPEVDGEVIVERCRASPGEFIRVRVTGALDYDLTAVRIP